MQKKRSRNRNLKKPKKPAIRRIVQNIDAKAKASTETTRKPKARQAKGLPLQEKTLEIIRIVNKLNSLEAAHHPFTKIMQRRKALYKLYASHSQIFSERKAILLKGRKNFLEKIELERHDLNFRLEQIGKPQLKLTMDEIIELILK